MLAQEVFDPFIAGSRLFCRYVESRRWLTPAVYIGSASSHSSHFDQPARIKLRALVEFAVNLSEDVWRNDPRIQAVPRYWRPLREALTVLGMTPDVGSEIIVTERRDAVDSFLSLDSTAGAIFFECDAGTVRFLSSILTKLSEILEIPTQWKLTALCGQVVAESPILVTAATFHCSSGIAPETLNKQTNDLAEHITFLWPLLYKLLVSTGCAATADECPREDLRAAWNYRQGLFFMPNPLRKEKFSDFDPAVQSQLDGFLFLGARECDDVIDELRRRTDLAIPSHDVPEERLVTAVSSRSIEQTGIELIIGDRANTVLVLVPWRFLGRLTSAHFARFGLECSLASELRAFCTFSERIFARLLELHSSNPDALSAADVRSLAYGSAACLEQYFNRSRSQSDKIRSLFDRSLALCGYLEVRRSVDELRRTVLAIAEGIEARENGKAQSRLTGIALGFSSIALLAIVLDGFNFVAGEAAEASLSPKIWLRTAIATVGTVGIVALARRILPLFRAPHVIDETKLIRCMRNLSSTSICIFGVSVFTWLTTIIGANPMVDQRAVQIAGVLPVVVIVSSSVGITSTALLWFCKRQ